MDYLRLNQEFHDGFLDLAKSLQLTRALGTFSLSRSRRRAPC